LKPELGAAQLREVGAERVAAPGGQAGRIAAPGRRSSSGGRGLGAGPRGAGARSRRAVGRSGVRRGAEAGSRGEARNFRYRGRRVVILIFYGVIWYKQQ